nr:MAG TPA: hypothetical protein [Caudoviricetes sp.]
MYTGGTDMFKDDAKVFALSIIILGIIMAFMIDIIW